MARTRDIVIGVIIGGSFLLFFLIMALSFAFSRYQDADGFSGLGSKVAIINLDGVIESSSDIVRQFERWGKDSHVHAIVLRINSPGGIVAPSQEIYDKIMKVRAETSKPVVVSMASVCASGGYYIACAADRIVAVPGTVTGSIGVIFEWPVVNRLMDKVGIQFQTVKSADNKDIGSPYREPTESDKAIFQSLVNDSYDQFVSVVSERRGLPYDSAKALATGAVFTGRQAQVLGLVDSLGTFDDAIDLAGEMSGLGKNPSVIKESPRRKVSLFDVLGSLTHLDLAKLVGSGQDWKAPKLQYIFN